MLRIRGSQMSAATLSTPVSVPAGDDDPDLSVLVPVFNEEAAVTPLADCLLDVLEGLPLSWEAVFVDDGSTDGTRDRLAEIASRDSRIHVVELARNCGQTAAMMAGIDYTRGRILVAMDGDGQNDPVDIPHLLAELDKGFDVVSGWRRDRKDDQLTRVLPSRLANALISFISGVRLHDYGCSLKAYRREVIQGVRLYGEMHRFVPIYAAWQGGRITEIPVRHHPRHTGESKYGLARVFKVLLDLLVIRFLDRYLTKPIYVFGAFGLFCLLAGLLAGFYSIYLKFGPGVSFIQTPLPLLVVTCFLLGVLSLLLGLVAEMLSRTYHEAQGKSVYVVRSRSRARSG